MNLLFFSSNSAYTEQGFYNRPVGGAETNLRIIAEEFAKLKYNVNYYSIKKGLPRKKNINDVRVYLYPLITIPLIHRNIFFVKKFNENNTFFQQQKIIEKIINRNNIDIIHTYSTYPDTYLSIKTAKKINVPIVQRVGGRAWFNIIQKEPSLKKRIEWTFNNVDVILCVSDFIKSKTQEYIEKLGMDINTQFITLDIGLNFDNFKNLDIEKVKNKYNLNDKGKIILCVGAFKDYSKRQDILIKALSLVINNNKNLRLVFIGDGPNLIKMKKLAKELKVDKSIDFLGIIPHNELIAIMSIVDIVALPTDFEGLSSVLKEAFVLGKTFLTSDIEPMRNIIKNGYNGFLVENEPNKFANKIQFLLDNQEKTKKIGENATKYANKYFDSKENIKKYDKLFLDITKSK
jgi:glycosyltransferase involved in cell wall biosynthesis